MEDKNVIKVQAKSNGAELNISAPSIKQTISATNNRAQYFAEQAKKYCDEAKTYRDTKSGIEGKLIANEDKYLYICVGNTTNYEGVTEVVNQGMDILEQVNQGIESRVKVDGSNAEFPYILDTYVNGTSGYRTWSDKYHEEWGFLASTSNASTTINYVKAFANTNYNLVVSMSASGTPNVNVGWQTKTTTSFVAYTYQQKNNPEGTHWRACGYIA